MQKNTFDLKRVVKTLSLVFVFFFILYSFIGILISGPVLKKEIEEASIVTKIKEENKVIKSVEKNIFRYVTYTGEDDSRYIIFDENGKRLAIRDKEDAKFDEVKQLLTKEYPNLVDQEIKIGYGNNKPAYIIEKDFEKLVLNYDNLRVVFYMKEGE